MDQLRVFLVDDEPWALVYLQKIIDWEENGFRIERSFENPEEALKAVITEEPDVIFVDIRMPQMDGLSFIRRAVEEGVFSRFVIVSGFAEFEYAQEALRLGVVYDYCLKPVEPEKLTDLLAKIRESSGMRDEEEKIPNTDNPVFREMLVYMHEHFQEKLVLKELAEFFHLNANYCCALFNKETGDSFSKYLTKIRMKEAMKLLGQGGRSVEEIAFLCGIQDYSYFNKVFKKYTGKTPGQYRRGDQEEGAGNETEL